MNGSWVEPDIRDEVVVFIQYWSAKCQMTEQKFCQLLSLNQGKFCEWKKRFGKENQHQNNLPSNSQLNAEEKDKIIDYYCNREVDGYRRCAYDMIDKDIVCATPSTVYRVLSAAGVLRQKNASQSGKKGSGFDQPESPHEHWHTDITYVTIGERFYYLVFVLDGYSRAILRWDLLESMCNDDVHGVIHKAIEDYNLDQIPTLSGSIKTRKRLENAEIGSFGEPRIITDRGAQFSGKEFKTMLDQHGFTHVMTSAYYPQSNGKIERFHQSFKNECYRKKVPLDKEQAMKIIAEYVRYYNEERLHSALNYITPKDKMNGRDKEILKLRDERLKNARIQRLERNQNQVKEIS